MKTTNLTKIVLSGLMGISLVACGSSNSSSATSEAETTSTTETKSETATLSGSLTASGSSALLPLAQAAAEAFMKTNADASIVVNGGGSGTGLKQVAEGSVDIGNSDVTAEEKLDADAAKDLVDHKVATVIVAPVVNKELGITNLTTEQLISIFTGETKNWSEVGGPDEEILLVTRPSSSGTRALFKSWALNGEEEASNEALETDDSGTLVQTISDNKGAIGYVALSYLVNNDSIQSVSIDGVEATLDNTYNGTYKVWGYEHMYTKGEGSELAQAFIEYMMSDAFASNIEGMGYGVSSKLSDAAIKTHE